MSKRTARIFGTHTVKQQLSAAPETILNAWLQESISTKRLAMIYQSLKTIGVTVELVSKASLDKLAPGQNHQGVILQVRQATKPKTHDLDAILAEHQAGNPLYLIIDSIQDPRNLGACIRTAVAVGVTAMIIPKHRSVSINETVRKVASGTADSIPIISVVNVSRTLLQMKQQGVWIVGAASGAKQSIYSLDLKVPIAIVIGSEHKGLRHSIQQQCDYIAAVPMPGDIDSLNVSVATAVILYEVVRQRL